MSRRDSSPLVPPHTYDPSFSDDLEALHAQEQEIAAEKTRQGVVIQHRSWPLAAAFRSDDDRVFGTGHCAILSSYLDYT